MRQAFVSLEGLGTLRDEPHLLEHTRKSTLPAALALAAWRIGRPNAPGRA